jgi:hypothetical protein
VKINLIAFDNTSGISQVSYSNDQSIWSDWEAYKELSNYNLPADNGQKTIYIKIKDYSGNEAGPFSETIILNLSGSQKPDQTPESSEAFDLVFWIITFFSIVIIILTIAGIVVFKRKKRKDQESLSDQALIIRSGGFDGPKISIGEITPATTLPQLPKSITNNVDQSATIDQLPMLARSTQNNTVSQQDTPSVQQLPQLPPGKTQDKTTEISSTSSITIPNSTETSQPDSNNQNSVQHKISPTLKTSGAPPDHVENHEVQAQTSAPAKASSTGPEVHLPNIISQPTLAPQNQPLYPTIDAEKTSEQFTSIMKSKPTNVPQIDQETNNLEGVKKEDKNEE